MSDAQYRTIEDDVEILVRLCGYSPEDARAELTAFSYRERAGLIPVSRALEILDRESRVDGDVADQRQRWRKILRTSGSLAQAA